MSPDTRSTPDRNEKSQHFQTSVDDPVAPVPHYPGEKADVKGELENDVGSLEDEEVEESIRLVPKIVRELVSMDDDPTLPTVTFR